MFIFFFAYYCKCTVSLIYTPLDLRHLRRGDRYAGRRARGSRRVLKSTSCEMKTTTNHNERRPAAPRPVAEVLRYEVQPVTNWFSRTRRRIVCYAGRQRTTMRFHTFLDPSLSHVSGVFILLSYIRYVHAPRDYNSLLDSATGRRMGIIKANCDLCKCRLNYRY